MEILAFHPAASRGLTSLSWLQSRHSFSFGSFYDPSRMGFGVLRVLNDDMVAGGRGFGTHPHENMEIISIPLQGELEHRDSMGHEAIIRPGDVQVMSAGTGIRHSEWNRSSDEEVRFLQLWLLPAKEDVAPRYGQVNLQATERMGCWQQVLSPDKEDEGVWVHQRAWFHLTRLNSGSRLPYARRDAANGIYVFILKGKFEVAGRELAARDGIGLAGEGQLGVLSREDDAELLLMEVPLRLS